MRFLRLNLFAAAVTLGSAGIGLADDRDTILASCAADTNLPPNICECIADRAAADLTDTGYALFVAMIGGNDAEAARLRAAAPMADTMAAGMFMTNAPADCARQ